MRLFLIAVMAAAAGPAADFELLEPELVRQMEDVGAAVDRGFRTVDGSRPAAVSAARGIFLPGYGAVFSVEVNLVPAASLSPFRRSYTGDEIRELNLRKRAALEPLRRRMEELLADSASVLSSLPPDLQVALAVSLFHFPWEDRAGLPSQIVISAERRRLSTATALVTRYY